MKAKTMMYVFCFCSLILVVGCSRNYIQPLDPDKIENDIPDGGLLILPEIVDLENGCQRLLICFMKDPDGRDIMILTNAKAYIQEGEEYNVQYAEICPEDLEIESLEKQNKKDKDDLEQEKKKEKPPRKFFRHYMPKTLERALSLRKKDLP